MKINITINLKVHEQQLKYAVAHMQNMQSLKR